jgi:hypothetical protein
MLTWTLNPLVKSTTTAGVKRRLAGDQGTGVVSLSASGEASHISYNPASATVEITPATESPIAQCVDHREVRS